MAKKVRISLANKCQLLFGAAVVLILTAALFPVWERLEATVREGQEMAARDRAEAWIKGREDMAVSLKPIEAITHQTDVTEDTLTLIAKDEMDTAAAGDPFLVDAVARFRRGHSEFSQFLQDAHGRPYFCYARALRKSDLARFVGGVAGFNPGVDVPGLADPLEMILYIQHPDTTARQRLLNLMYVIFAGLFAGLLAIGTFWFITTRLILSPVLVLRQTAEKVADGDLNIRADVNTGDEFEQLADIFNHMLENLKKNQEQLHSSNKSLDLKLGELAESNVALYEANKIKGEFLANVSHELRTPLNSIIGFAEVLEETLKERTGPVDEKRKRYVANIITSSRRLLDLINDLLDLAKIEAGRVELHVVPMSVQDTAEGLVNLIRPQAEKHGIELRLRVGAGIPPIVTDASKLQQVLFNFLSNAVKFTPAGGTVTLTARMIGPKDPATPPGLPAPGTTNADGTPATAPGPGAESAPAPPPALPAGGDEAATLLCVSISDTGPGIPLDQQERIFEKFTQLDSTVTKEYQGTGLGLTICRELAAMLQGQIVLDSDVGRGATFSIILPRTLEAKTMPLMPDLAGPSPLNNSQSVVRLAGNTAPAADPAVSSA